MFKLHYCLNGRPVTEQVILYQNDRRDEDYLPILYYYDNFKEVWYQQLEDYMDRATFDADYDYRLVRAVESYDAEHAISNASTKGLSFAGNFNRWFYKILANWKSNVKTSSFRLKKRPSVQCPVCGRKVGRIDEEHLKHVKGLSDLPKFMHWKGNIYEVFRKPAVYAVTWGKKLKVKWRSLTSGNYKSYADERRRIRWPWRLADNKRGVLCPFTKRIVEVIDEHYILSLPAEYRCYAPPTKWPDFVAKYPGALIQSEIFSLDHEHGGRGENDSCLRERIESDVRIATAGESIEYEDICKGKVPFSFEHAFRAVDCCVKDGTDREILKMVAAGYEIEDIAETLETDRKEVRRRLRVLRDSNKELRTMLLG